MIYAEFEAGRMRELKYKICRAKVVYLGIEADKKPSSSGKGTGRWMFCIYLSQNHLFWAFAAGILWKTQLWNIFAGVPTAKCIASCNRCDSLQDDYCVLFFNLKFLIPTLCHMFCLPKPSNIYGESD